MLSQITHNKFFLNNLETSFGNFFFTEIFFYNFQFKTFAGRLFAIRLTRLSQLLRAAQLGSEPVAANAARVVQVTKSQSL